MSNAVWVDDTPFCAGCGEILSQEDQDFETCACCGGEGFPEDDDYYDADECQHCGATWQESVDCAMNGCPMGTNKHRFPEGPDLPAVRSDGDES